MAEQTKSARKLTTTQIILIAGIVVIAAAILVVGVFVLGKQQPDDPSPTAVIPGGGNLVMDDQNARNIVDELNEKLKDGLFEVKMTPNWVIPNGKGPSPDAYVANSVSNHRSFYFEVALESGEVVYTSPEVPLGAAVKDITLTRALDPGDYECVCTYNLLDEEKQVVNSISVVVRLRVTA